MNMLISTAAFLYCMYLIGSAMMLGVGSISKNGLNFGDVIMMIAIVVLSHYTLRHWVVDLMDWTRPPETPEDKDDH